MVCASESLWMKATKRAIASAVAPMPNELAIRNRLISNLRFTGDKPVEVNFQRRDSGSDLRKTGRDFLATGGAVPPAVRERPEMCLRVFSRMIEFIVVNWLGIAR